MVHKILSIANFSGGFAVAELIFNFDASNPGTWIAVAAVCCWVVFIGLYFWREA